jgi:Secretion system C-terminal sorting domain
MLRSLFFILSISLLLNNKLIAQNGFLKLVDTAIVSNDTSYKMIGYGTDLAIRDSNYYYWFFIHDTFNTGFKPQIWLTKTSMNGKVLKINKIQSTSNTGYYNEYGYGNMLQSVEGYFYKLCTYYDVGMFKEQNYLIKFDTSLNLIWKIYIFFDPLVDSNFNNNTAHCLKWSVNGDIIVCGAAGDTNHVDNVVLEYDTAGNQTAFHKYSSSSTLHNGITSLIYFNNFYIANYTQQINNFSYDNAGFLKLDDSLNLLSNTLKTDTVFINGFSLIKKFNDSKFIFFAVTDTLHTLGYTKYVIALMDTNLNVLWKRLYNIENNPLQNMFDIIVTSDKKIVFSGDAPVDSCTYLKSAGWLSELDSNGNTLWDRRYYFRRNCQTTFMGLAETENKNILGVGSISPTWSGTQLPQHVWIIKVDSNGKVNPSDSGFINPCAAPNAIIEVGNVARQIVNLYPNPANNYLELMYNLYSNGKLQILDISGKLLFQSELNSNDHEARIDISNFSNGIYFLKITTKDKDETVKFVKQ